jgi:hypothetical protein
LEAIDSDVIKTYVRLGWGRLSWQMALKVDGTNGDLHHTCRFSLQRKRGENRLQTKRLLAQLCKFAPNWSAPNLIEH